MAGISFLRARSPVTPKMTRPHGPAICGSRRSCGSRSGLAGAARRCRSSSQQVHERGDARWPGPARAAAGRVGRARRARAASPADWAAIRVPKENGRSGISTSCGSEQRDLEEDALGRAALVVLPGRVQEPRSPAEAGGPLRAPGQGRRVRRAGRRRARGRRRPSRRGSRRRPAGASSASTAPASVSTPSSRPADPRTSMPPSVNAAGSGSGCASSSPRAAFLALSTSGWSNGLMPISRPATAVAASQTSSCAPSVPDTVTHGSPSPAGAASPAPGGTRATATTSAAGQASLGGLGALDGDGQHALAELAGGLGDQLLSPVGEARDAGPEHQRWRPCRDRV